VEGSPCCVALFSTVVTLDLFLREGDLGREVVKGGVEVALVFCETPGASVKRGDLPFSDAPLLSFPHSSLPRFSSWVIFRRNVVTSEKVLELTPIPTEGSRIDIHCSNLTAGSLPCACK
jgi:hypothetical protein